MPVRTFHTIAIVAHSCNSICSKVIVGIHWFLFAAIKEAIYRKKEWKKCAACGIKLAIVVSGKRYTKNVQKKMKERARDDCTRGGGGSRKR